MRRISFFQDMLSNLLEPGKIFRSDPDGRSMLELCRALLSERGEVSGSKLAASALGAFQALSEEQRLAFFLALAEDFDLDPDAVAEAATAYKVTPGKRELKQLMKSAEPQRIELLRRLNQVPGATESLVRMREVLMKMIDDNPVLERADSDFERLFAGWFNRGFLVLRPIDWKTPANILEKIIQYEAVHAINDWNDLRRRLEPEDRRCFAFFHPVMPEEPLIFVEVALTRGIPDSIDELLSEERKTLAEAKADTAVFYSISNCQAGLKGVSFGNFLIKQVVSDLSQSLPNIRNFVTLSPVPGFRKWLLEAKDDALQADGGGVREFLDNPPVDDEAALARYERPVRALIARYLVEARNGRGQPVDPVARFHLGNGASLHRVNWLANRSESALRTSGSVMVNYLYDLDTIEANHENYVQEGKVNASREVRTLAKQDATVSSSLKAQA